MAKELKIDGVMFTDGSSQVTQGASYHYAGVTLTAPATVNLTLSRAAFTPAIPSDVSVIPFIVVHLARAWSSMPGGGAMVYGYGVATGTPFGGTTVGEGFYTNVNVNDVLSLTGRANSTGSHSFVVTAILNK